MTHDELRDAAVDLARRSAQEQGLPEKVTDPATLANLAVAFAPTPKPVAQPRRSRGRRKVER